MVYKYYVVQSDHFSGTSAALYYILVKMARVVQSNFFLLTVATGEAPPGMVCWDCIVQSDYLRGSFLHGMLR